MIWVLFLLAYLIVGVYFAHRVYTGDQLPADLGAAAIMILLWLPIVIVVSVMIYNQD